MYKIEMNRKQVETIMKALDTFSRLKCGQLNELVNLYYDKLFKGDFSRDEFEYKVIELKGILFKDLNPYASYGIAGKDAPEDSQIAFDIYQALRNRLAFDDHPEGGITVDFHDVFKTSEEEVVKIEKK